MGRRNPAVFTLLATISVVASVVYTQPVTTHQAITTKERSATSNSSPVEALDRCIQARFHTLTGFGMGRIPVVPQHVQQFKPETPDEKAAAAQLQQAGWKVALYLGGRGLQGARMTQAEWEKAGAYSFRRAISQPLIIANQNTPQTLPQPWELWAQGQQALSTSPTNSNTGAVGQWAVEVRPVRANQQACLKCHDTDGATGYPPKNGIKSSLHIGDAVGVAIYVYQRIAKP